MARLTAIICTYKRYDALPAAIESLLNQRGLDEPIEILVVDQSPDQSRAYSFSCKYSEKCIKFIFEKIANLSNARNLGARAASGDIVAYLDDDAIADPQWAASLIAAFAAFPFVFVGGGPVRPNYEENPPSWLGQHAHDLLSLIDRGDTLRLLESHEWLAGCNIAFDRAALLEAGGFSTHLGRSGGESSLLGNEERVMCERLASGGGTMVYSPAASVEHFIPADRLRVQWFVRRIAWQAISDVLANPTASISHVSTLKKKHSRWQLFFRFVKIIPIIIGSRKSVTDKELFLIYELQLLMACSFQQHT